MRLLSALVAAAAFVPSFVSAYTNPVIYEDLADVDLRRYNDTYYMSASTMHFSPGAPILRSYDLVNWQFIGHSVPALSPYFGPQYALPPGSNGYIGGVWASWLIFVPSQQKWFWGGCVNFYESHVFSSANADPASSWSQIATVDGCQYDSGAFQDTDGTVYVSSKNLTDDTIHIAQMSTDMKTVVKQALVFTLPSDKTSMEGTRPYLINGTYYIFSDDPSAGGTNVLRSSGDVWGPYTLKPFITQAQPQAPLSGQIDQGALVDTPAGGWYWMGFSWSYPNGRIPVLLPVTWSDGWPSPVLSGTSLLSSYPNPVTPVPISNDLTGVDYFAGSSLGPQWEWNHDPDTSNYTVNNGLTLKTASLTPDWYAARNTLTHRQLGPVSTATIKMSLSGMLDGDRAGLGLLRDQSAYIGVWRSGSTYTVTMVNNITMDTSWVTTSTGTTAGTAPLAGTTVFFRVISDSTPGGDSATFWYSADGNTFQQLGPAFACDTNWQFFEGQRFAIFNFAIKTLGGSVKVADFELAAGSYTGVAVGAGSSTSTSTTATSTTKTSSTTSSPTTTTTTTKTSSTTSSPTTSTTKTTSTSTKPTTTTSSAVPTCTAAHYAQCGGTGWTGCTTCAAGSTCKVSNPYYAQCL